MSPRGLCRVIFAIVFLVWASQAATVAAAESAALRYGFKDGQTYVYDLSIQVDLPDGQRTISGLSKYQVKSVDAATGRITLTHSADLATSWKAPPQANLGPRAMRLAVPPPFIFTNYNAPCQIVIDPDGTIVRYERKSQLPYLLGNAWALAIEPLPAAGQKTWQRKRDIEIVEQETSFWMVHPLANKAVNRSAKEVIDYSVADPAAQPLVITRAYSLTTEEQVNGEAVFSQKGEGKVTFDSSAGMVQGIDEKYTLHVNDPGVTLRIPIAIEARLLSDAEAQKFVADRKAATQQARLAAEESQKAKPIDDSELDQLLGSIKSSNQTKHHQALDKLARSTPIEKRRDEVAAILVGLLSARDNWTVTSAEKALKLWGNDKSTEALIKLLDDRSVFIRNGAIDALATSKSAAVADAVAKCLTDPGAGQQASKALKAMGDIAEKPVLPLLKDKEWTVRMSACEILAVTGTAQSSDALKAASNDENGLVQMKATEALKAIESRAKK